jgi:hypothetical protein
MDLEHLQNSFPDKVPVIVADSKSMKKFLVPRRISLNEFVFFYRQKMNLQSKTAIFVEIKGQKYISFKVTFEELYRDFKNDDGLLYLQMIQEDSLGFSN